MRGFRPPSGPRTALGILVGALFWLLLILFSSAQVTSPGPGQALLSRAIAALLDLDAALPYLVTSLHQQAQEASQPIVQVPDYPVPIEVDRDMALAMDQMQLRALLLDETARRVYDQGMGILAEDEGRSLDPFSAPGLIDRGLGLIREEVHLWLTVATIVVVIAWAGIAWSATAGLKWPTRLLLWGGTMAAGALTLVLTALLARVAMKALQAGSDPLIRELWQVGLDASSLFLRNALATSALGSASSLLGILSLTTKRTPS